MAQKKTKKSLKGSLSYLNNHQNTLELVLAFLRGTLFRLFVGLWRVFAELLFFCFGGWCVFLDTVLLFPRTRKRGGDLIYGNS